MTLKNWLSKQGWPHGMECVGEVRLQQLWDAAQSDARLQLIKLVQRCELCADFEFVIHCINGCHENNYEIHTTKEST